MGYITCDAYVSYKVLEAESGGNITVTGCLMHCRRYFAEAFFINDIASMSDEQLKELPETKVLFLIRDIYIEEDRLRNLSADERLTLRQKKVSPLVDRFFTYIHELDRSDEVFSDRMTKAIGYAINQEEHLRVFLTDGNHFLRQWPRREDHTVLFNRQSELAFCRYHTWRRSKCTYVFHS
jgi:hypothetical protein